MRLPSQKEFQLMALLSDGREYSGRTVAQMYFKETARHISYGTLYTTFRRLKEAGWVTAHDDDDEDGRVRYFKLSQIGARALSEARRNYSRLAGFAAEGAHA